MSIGLLNGLQSGMQRGLSPGMGNGLDTGIYNGVYGELGGDFTYGFPTSKYVLWLDPSYGLNIQNLGAISSWKDRFNRYTYTQSTTAAQPRLIVEDSNFNNKPIIDFNTTGRGVFITNGPLLSGDTTLVMVYQYISGAENISGHSQSRVISNGDEQSARSFGVGYSWQKFNNTVPQNEPGYRGDGNNNTLVASSSLFNTNRYIIVMNKNLWLANNNNVTITTGSLSNIPTFRINAIGGSGVSFSGVFKLGEVLLFNYAMSSTEASFISDRLNQKYLIY